MPNQKVIQKKLNLKNIEMQDYCGSELFKVQCVSKEKTNGKIKNYDYPFNIEFKKITEFYKGKEDDFKGSGIYLITFNHPDKYNEEIIYIGKYMPYNDGNVITDRWIKHIATITNRGHRVGGFGNKKIRNKKNPKYLTLSKIEKNDEKIKNIWNLIKIAGRIQDTGCSTSVKRLEFASNKWNTFKNNCNTSKVRDIENFREDVLQKFQFHYMQLNGHKYGEIPDSVKEKEYYENLASLVETYLLWKYNPACNSNEGLNEINDKTVDEIKTEIKSFLEKLN